MGDVTEGVGPNDRTAQWGVWSPKGVELRDNPTPQMGGTLGLAPPCLCPL